MTADRLPSRDASPADFALADEVEFLVVKASTVGTRLARTRLRPLGLHVRSYSALTLAASHPAGLSQREMAEYLDLDPSQVVGLIDELESGGLATREMDPSDRRRWLIRTTAKGEALAVEARAQTAAAEDEALTMLSIEERATLLRLLRKVVFGAADPL